MYLRVKVKDLKRYTMKLGSGHIKVGQHRLQDEKYLEKQTHIPIRHSNPKSECTS